MWHATGDQPFHYRDWRRNAVSRFVPRVLRGIGDAGRTGVRRGAARCAVSVLRRLALLRWFRLSCPGDGCPGDEVYVSLLFAGVLSLRSARAGKMLRGLTSAGTIGSGAVRK